MLGRGDKIGELLMYYAKVLNNLPIYIKAKLWSVNVHHNVVSVVNFGVWLVWEGLTYSERNA